MSFIIFILVLSILIIVHEAGHFVTAKSLGVRVERFAIGFGPKIFSSRKNGTDFAVCLFPLGGYVKMAGDERSECKGEKDEYYSRSPGHRALIVLFGPVVNYLLAYLCFCVVFVIGYPTLSAKVGELIKDYPAQTAGLEAGDKILSIDGQRIESWEEMQKYISSSKTPTLQLTVLHDGKEVPKTIVPKIENLENIFGQKENVRIIGIRPAEDVIFLKYGVFESFGRSFNRLADITTVTYKALYRMATGAMSAKDTMTGPIGIFYIIQKAASLGFSYLLYIMAVISASLAIFNLLPLPVLDGGHLFLLGVERLRGKPLPQRVDDTVNRIGLSFIICLAVFVFYSDFVRYGWIDKFVSFWKQLGL